MPLTDLSSKHFSDTEKTAVNTALVALETALANKMANLSAEERQQYGSVNEQNKLVINKIKEFRDTQPTLSSPDVDWVEFANDFDTRNFLQNTIQRMQSLIDGMNSAKTLHDWDNYQAALTDYDYTKYKVTTNAPGFQTKAAEVGQFFIRTANTLAAAKKNTESK